MGSNCSPAFKCYIGIDYSGAEISTASLKGLRVYLHQLGSRIHFWPFDGWEIPAGRSAMVEAYPSLWSRSFEREGRNADQHDAYSVAAWMRNADLDGSLAGFFKPSLTPGQRMVAQIEGWILGVM